MSGRQQPARRRQAPRRSHGAVAPANENEILTQKNSVAEKKEYPPVAVKNRSVIRAFAILKSFYAPDEWVAACELSRRAGIHEATVNRFMHTLQEVGAVVRDEDGRYRCVLFVMPGMHRGPFIDNRGRARAEAAALS